RSLGQGRVEHREPFAVASLAVHLLTPCAVFLLHSALALARVARHVAAAVAADAFAAGHQDLPAEPAAWWRLGLWRVVTTHWRGLARRGWLVGLVGHSVFSSGSLRFISPSRGICASALSQISGCPRSVQSRRVPT